jgi:hypothetical protein
MVSEATLQGFEVGGSRRKLSADHLKDQSMSRGVRGQKLE